MTGSPDSKPARRAPVAFDATDPALEAETEASRAPLMAPRGRDVPPTTATVLPPVPEGASTAEPRGKRRFRPGWLTLLIACLTGLVSLAAGLAFAQFVSGVLARSDWIGMAGWGLLALAGLAAVVLVSREAIGFLRLGRLASLRREAERLTTTPDVEAERQIVRRLRDTLGNRGDLAWAAARFSEHERDVRDPGDLLRLADRELIAPLDAEARRMILTSAKRVSLVTAMSPIAFVAVGFVLVENLGLLRRLATLYGGRPGWLGGLRLARMVMVHILATGGVALTDDLVGQFIGQDIARRLSRRLGEGLFNGALTARIGVAALDVCRPLPFIDAKPVRIRDVLAELTRRAAPTAAPAKP